MFEELKLDWYGASLPLIGMNPAHQFGRTAHEPPKFYLMCLHEPCAAPSHTWLRNHCRLNLLAVRNLLFCVCEKRGGIMCNCYIQHVTYNIFSCVYMWERKRETSCHQWDAQRVSASGIVGWSSHCHRLELIQHHQPIQPGSIYRYWTNIRKRWYYIYIWIFHLSNL